MFPDVRGSGAQTKMSLDKNIITLVEHARHSVEELAYKYHDGGAWGPDLAGYCGIASRFFISLARRNNIYNTRLICGLFDGMTHCWIEYGDFCIDITISQFAGYKNRRYRIFKIDSDFYRAHYTPEIIGTAAVRHQKQWELGQNYESCSSLLWRIHKAKYIKEYNGLLLR